jgi:fatty acid desaturase
MKVFAHDTRDAFLVLLGLLQPMVMAYATLSFGRQAPLLTIGLAVLLVFWICTNYQCIAHNFIHTPFFSARWLNHVFSAVNTLGLGVPQSLYRFHHLHHHKYNNDALDPATGTTLDQSSTYRYSRMPPAEEGILTYSLLGFFRSNFGFVVQGARRQGRLGPAIAEATVLIAMMVTLAILNPRGFLFFYLPVWYLGQCGALAENYLEHHGARPGDRVTDSVSCYAPLYNLIWFNNGYHQEHHYRPQTHWTKIPAVRPELPPNSERRVTPWAHWFNFDPIVRRFSKTREGEQRGSGPSMPASA